MSAVDLISLCTVRLTGYRKYDDGTKTGKSVMSGFIWRNDGADFLITNWHNVTGLHPDSEEPIGSFTPTHFCCEYKAVKNDDQSIASGTVDLSLYNNEENPKWIEHPQGRLIDVVAIPFYDDDLPDNYDLLALNEQDFQKDWNPRIGSEGFIVGYPEGFSGPLTTPIWKRGSVSTEPSLDHQEKPMFLVDTIGNKGLSGSCVIGRSSGIFMKGGKLTGTEIIGTWENFIGIYSGRVSDEGIGSQLGRVWKASVLEEIFSLLA
ncbi:MAG: hypothetical protein ABJ275_03330 [Maricaulaceae bacterium]